MKLKKKDFIEIEFTGKIKETGEVFDTNVKKELEKLHLGHDHPIEAKPLTYCLGEGMFLEGIDNILIGKDLGSHKIELKAEKAFGNRQKESVKMIPLKVFVDHKINPVQGATLNFDGQRGRVLSVSGGRVLIDFNHPLAGKDVVYDIKINKKIEDIKEKIKAFNEFIFKKDLKFEIKGKKIIIEAENEMKNFVEMFKPKFKEIFDMDLEIKDNKKKEEKKKEKK